MKYFNDNTFAKVTVAMLGIGFFAAGAQAGEASSVTVRYADLNLNTAAGAKVLYQRINTAAKQVCGEADARQLQQAAAVKACLNQAIENSVRHVDNTQLTHEANERGFGIRSAVVVASNR